MAHTFSRGIITRVTCIVSTYAIKWSAEVFILNYKTFFCTFSMYVCLILDVKRVNIDLINSIIELFWQFFFWKKVVAFCNISNRLTWFAMTILHNRAIKVANKELQNNQFFPSRRHISYFFVVYVVWGSHEALKLLVKFLFSSFSCFFANIVHSLRRYKKIEFEIRQVSAIFLIVCTHNMLFL